MSITRNAPRAFWLLAQSILNTLYNLFGEPQDIAQQGWVSRQSHALMARWIRSAEALLRRLLLLEAAALKLPPAPVSRRAPRVRTRRLHEFYPEDPQTWRVSLRCSAPQSRRRGGRTSRGGGALSDAFVLALRYEALLRAYNDPAPYAHRLARRLARTPAVTQAVLTPHADAVHLLGDEYCALDAAAHAVRMTPAAPRSNSS